MTRKPDDREKSGSFPLSWITVAAVGLCCALPLLISAVAAGSTFAIFNWLGLSSLLVLGGLALLFSFALLRRWKGRAVPGPQAARRGRGLEIGENTRLAGGAGSLGRTRLQGISLLNRENTGNFLESGRFGRD